MDSRCTPQLAKGTLSFDVTGYRQLLRGFARKCIRSSSIDVGGYSWCLCFYPDGDDRENTRGFVGVFLQLLTQNVEVKALHDFKLIDLTTGSPYVLLHSKEPRIYDTTDIGEKQTGGWGMYHHKFLERNGLESSVYLRDDRLVIECDITVVLREPLVVDTMRTTSVAEALHRNLSRDLAILLESMEGADVTFEVQGEILPAHAVVLGARSPVFKAKFDGPLREEIGKNHITIHDMQPDVFKALLYFIYADAMSPCIDDDGTDGGDEKKELTKNLLVAGDRYEVQGLRSVCETKLCESLDVSTVATMLAFAVQNNCEKLKDACVGFMASNCKLEDLVASNGYEVLKSSYPAVFVHLYEKAAARARKI
jgi:speckle-type POZ protein